MKKLYFFLIIAIFVMVCNVQGKNTTYMAKDTRGIEDKISRVENRLLIAVEIEGEKNKISTIQERMKYFDVPGLSIAVIKDNQIEWAKSYGVKDKETKEKVTLNTLFQAASLSKPVTAMIALKLAAQGKIDLKRDINKQIKTWQIPENEFTKQKAVTPELLILHLSGLNVPAYPGYSTTDSIPNTIDILNGSRPANTEPTKVEIVPGTEWRYSGAGYTVLELLMLEVTGKSFPLLMKELLFIPLGLKNSTFSHNLSGSKQNLIAKAYKEDGSMVAGGYHVYPEKAAAGLWTTSLEYAKIIIELQKSYFGNSNKIITQKTAQFMLTKHWRGMGLGFILRNEGDRIALAFSGGNEGYICDIYSYLHSGSGVVIMTNSNNGAPLIEEIYRSLSREYSWPDFKQKTIRTIKVDTPLLSKYVGIYKGLSRDKEEFSFELILKDDHLYLKINEKTYKLFPIDINEFVIPEQDWRLSFIDNTEKIESVKFRLEYGRGVAKRIK